MRPARSASKPKPKIFSSTPSKPAPLRRSSGAGIRPALFYGAFAALLGTNALTLVGFLMAPDVARLVSGQSDAVASAYENRIAQLRVEVDRLHSRRYAQAGDINLQLQELAQQQEVLLEQHQLVKQLAAKAEAMGITTASLSAPDDSITDDDTDAALKAAFANPGTPALGQASAVMTEMMSDSRLALAALSESATKSTATIVGELKPLGIRPNLPNDPGEGVGGPYLPPVDGADADSLVDDANDVFLALARYKAAQNALELAPVHLPLSGPFRESSRFGNRADPFTKGRAFHAGVDFAAPRGTTVLSAGFGKVTFVGQMSGYGNVVEVTHDVGLTTRYAHLSAFLVKVGQVVSTGSPIAQVGSTGRSTGPHLHFEVRRKEGAVDPQKYLNAGKRLKRFVGA